MSQAPTTRPNHTAAPPPPPTSPLSSSTSDSSDRHLAPDDARAARRQSRTPIRTPSGSDLSEGAGERALSGSRRPAPHVSQQRLDKDVNEKAEAEAGRDDNHDDVEGEESGEEDASFVLEEDPVDMGNWAGQASVKGSSETVRMILLSFAAIGITFTWGIEMTYCTPYLLNLGLTKSNTSLVWIAGPLSGLIVQPVVGVIADESTSRFGRRRPFIVLGSLVVAGSLLTLGFTKEIVGIFISSKDAARTVTIVVAVLAIYAVDFAINAVMSCARSLVVDTLPMEKQQAGAAWNSRMAAVGHMMGYGAGAIDLVSIFGTAFGDTQFKQLTLIATTFMLLTSGVTCWAVTERVLMTPPRARQGGESRLKIFRQIWSTLLNLPPRIQAICWAVFWSWIGWFPFLFYSTTWVGETYFRYDVPEDAKNSNDALGDIGRIGSTSLVVYSCITFLGAWLLPMLVKSPEDEKFTHRPPRSIAVLVERFNKIKPDLLTVWICGHLIFAGAMSLAPFATSFRFATFLVALCGLPWTIAMWAPTTFLGVEVNKMSGGNETTAAYRRLSGGASMTELPNLAQDGTAVSPRFDRGSDLESANTTSSGELSGIYFGILNIYTTLPQFVGTFLSTIVFAILEPGKSPELATDAHPSEHHGTDGPNAIAVCLFIGAMSTLGAAYATRRLKYL